MLQQNMIAAASQDLPELTNAFASGVAVQPTQFYIRLPSFTLIRKSLAGFLATVVMPAHCIFVVGVFLLLQVRQMVIVHARNDTEQSAHLASLCVGSLHNLVPVSSRALEQVRVAT